MYLNIHFYYVLLIYNILYQIADKNKMADMYQKENHQNIPPYTY